MTFSRHQLGQRTTLDAVDLQEVHRCRRAHNQLGFACQVGFVRLLNRFPKQEPFEVLDELLLFTGVQLGVDSILIEAYRHRRQTISEHQQRILKTEFILQYMTEPALRTRIRRGLLKVEQMHALARDVFYGNRGRIDARELWEQMNSCSCLTLIVACIIYWQAKDMSRVIRRADPEGHGVELSLLRHVSPIEWDDNIVLYGEYVLNRSLVRLTRSRR